LNSSFLFLLFILFGFGNFVSVLGSVENFSIDKSLYHDGDTLKISGTVNYDPVIPSVILQIITPGGTGLAGIANVLPKSDGSFSTMFHVGGPTWPEDGTYTVKVSYGGNLEKTFSYQKLSVNPKNDDSTDNSSNDSTDNSNELFAENPKIRIPGFPSLDRSPQYYIDRYNNEPNYKSWFDSQFPDYLIQDVVGYKSTHILNFPSLEYSPQYYIDRYNNEPNYKSWFDSQFPEKSIYDVLGFSPDIPDWIKTYAKLWATGDVSDSEFISGLDFMLEHHIIVIPNLQYSGQNYVSDIPNWVRNNANWWANDLISQQEFVNSLEYLIEKQIIEIE
jgi:hypothetical protein